MPRVWRSQMNPGRLKRGCQFSRFILQLHFAIVAGQRLVFECSELTGRHVGGVRDRRCDGRVRRIV